MAYRLVLWLAIATLLGHVCGLEDAHARGSHGTSWESPADAHPAGSVAIHDASCEGLRPTSTSLSPDVGFLGAQPLAVSDGAVTAPAGAARPASPPGRPALFVLHRALLI